MNRLRAFPFFAVPALLATIAVGSLARADVLPPNDCSTAGPGTACSTAGPHSDQEGVCTSATCQSGTPDAGSFACVLCELVDGGPNNDASVHDAAASDAAIGDAAAADATVADAGGSTTSLASSSKSCSVSPNLGAASGGGSWLFGLGAIGLVASALRRRRKE